MWVTQLGLQYLLDSNAQTQLDSMYLTLCRTVCCVLYIALLWDCYLHFDANSDFERNHVYKVCQSV